MLPVSGTVTLDGQPLPGVNIMMIREDGMSVMAKTDSTGSFSKAGTGPTDGIPEGTYKVGVNVFMEIVDGEVAGATPAPKILFDPKYMSADTSGLTITVSEGMTPVELSLTKR